MNGDTLYAMTRTVKDSSAANGQSSTALVGGVLGETADLRIVSAQIHPDVRIHMPRKAQMRKSYCGSLRSHFLCGVHPVAKCCMRMKIAPEHFKCLLP